MKNGSQWDASSNDDDASNLPAPRMPSGVLVRFATSREHFIVDNSFALECKSSYLVILKTRQLASSKISGMWLAKVFVLSTQHSVLSTQYSALHSLHAAHVLHCIGSPWAQSVRTALHSVIVHHGHNPFALHSLCAAHILRKRRCTRMWS